MSVAPTVLRVEGLHKAFDGHEVLRGVDLEIRRGECVALVGQSGAGKTVLLEHLVGAMTPDRGRILVPHPDRPEDPLVDMAELDDDEIDRVRSQTAVVFQQDALYSGTVHENIALALRETHHLPDFEIEERIHESLTEVGLPPTPTLLNKHRDKLSGGMRKRVAIARALALRPVAIAYDDPTAGLDPARASAIHELIWKAHQTLGAPGFRQTTLVITHDKDLLRRFEPRVVMLEEGRVFFDGPWTEFCASDSPVIRPYFDLPPSLS